MNKYDSPVAMPTVHVSKPAAQEWTDFKRDFAQRCNNADTAAPAQSGEADCHGCRDRVPRTVYGEHVMPHGGFIQCTAPQPSQPVEAGEADWVGGHIATFCPDGDDYVVMFNRDMLPRLRETGELRAYVRAAPSAVVLDDGRAAFEAQFERTLGYKPERYSSFNYERDNAKSLWKWWQWAWQARAASPQAKEK